MPNLRYLIEEDLSQGIARDYFKAREHAAKAESALKDNNPEIARMHYGAALRFNPDNRETQRLSELVSNYVEGKNLLLNNSTAAVSNLKRVLSIDRNFRSALNILRTAAVLADDWETITGVGIQTVVDKPDLEYIGIDIGKYVVEMQQFAREWREKERSFFNSNWPSIWGPNKLASFPNVECVDSKIFSDYHNRLLFAEKNRWRQVGYEMGFINPHPHDEAMGTIYRLGKNEGIDLYNLRRKSKVQTFKTRPKGIGKVTDYTLPTPSETIYPILIPLWEIPFKIEYHRSYGRTVWVPTSFWQMINNWGDRVSIYGRARYESEEGKIIINGNGNVIDWNPKEWRFRFCEFIEWKASFMTGKKYFKSLKQRELE